MPTTVPPCSPTDDPEWWRMDEVCHHPERVRHLTDAKTAAAFPHE